jgi:hypothetical protein
MNLVAARVRFTAPRVSLSPAPQGELT